MCLIIVSTNPTEIPQAIADSAYQKNPDGLGFLYYDENGKLQGEHLVGLSQEQSWEAVQEYAGKAEASDSRLAIHWRYATHGAATLELCHPFWMETPEGVVGLMHNGILDAFAPPKSVCGASDTGEFVREMSGLLQETGISLLRNSGFRRILEGMLGTENRLVIAPPVSAEKRFMLFPESSGLMVRGHWFSNTYAWDVRAWGDGSKEAMPELEYQALMDSTQRILLQKTLVDRLTPQWEANPESLGTALLSLENPTETTAPLQTGFASGTLRVADIALYAREIAWGYVREHWDELVVS